MVEKLMKMQEGSDKSYLKLEGTQQWSLAKKDKKSKGMTEAHSNPVHHSNLFSYVYQY